MADSKTTIHMPTIPHSLKLASHTIKSQNQSILLISHPNKPRNDQRLEIVYSRLVPTDHQVFQPERNHPSEYLKGDWQVVLYVDNHERNNATGINTQIWVDGLNSKICNRYHEWRTHVELKSLAAGDYLWVAKKGTDVRVLDYCVERKTRQDLERCLATASRTYPNIVKMRH